MKHRNPLAALCLAGFIAGLTPGTAAADGMYLRGAAPTAEGGFVHPALLVGFNPQPDPPGVTLTANLREPAAPQVGLVQPRSDRAELSLAVAAAGGVRSMVVPARLCGGERDTRIFPLRGSVQLPPGPCIGGPLFVDAALADGTTMHLRLDLSAASGELLPGSIVAFNPQPEPPGLPAAVVLELRFDGAASDIGVGVSAEINGATVSWQ